MKPYVVYWNNIPTPYMVERFNALSQSKNLNFEAWFNRSKQSDRSWNIDEESWAFSYKYIPSTSVLGKSILYPHFLFKKKVPDLVVSLYAEPIFISSWLLAKLRGIKICFWAQVTNDAWNKRVFWKELIKKIMFPTVDATFGSGEESRAFAIHYGASPEKARILQHSIDVSFFVTSRARLLAERESLRHSIGLKGISFIYVGRLWEGKGLQYLLDAFKIVQCSSYNEVSLLFVGDGVEEQLLRKKVATENLRNVFFAGFIQKEELPKYYVASDVFVFPTLGDPYGLVVDEALAISLPVVSSSAAGEISSRITNGYNGFIVPPGDAESLADKMLLIASKPDLLAKLSENTKDTVNQNTPEKWANDFETAVLQILKR